MPDVERFDLEPRRPLLHGSIPEVTTESLSGLTTEQKIPLVLDIIGADTMSARLRASLIEIAPSLTKGQRGCGLSSGLINHNSLWTPGAS